MAASFSVPLHDLAHQGNDLGNLVVAADNVLTVKVAYQRRFAFALEAGEFGPWVPHLGNVTGALCRSVKKVCCN
jgi:hypothetical protein